MSKTTPATLANDMVAAATEELVLVYGFHTGNDKEVYWARTIDFADLLRDSRNIDGLARAATRLIHHKLCSMIGGDITYDEITWAVYPYTLPDPPEGEDD